MKKIVLIILMIPILFSCGKDSGSDILSPGGTGQGGSLARFAIAGNHLYAVNGTKLKVFNIQTPENPVFLSEQDLRVDVETIFGRDENTLFIGSTNGMFIYSISRPSNPELVGTYEHIVSCDPVVANDKYAYVTLRSSVQSNVCNRSINQLDIIDIRDLSRPSLVHSVPMVHPIGLGLYGDTLLVCDEGVKVFNVSDPTDLHLINNINGISAVDIIPYGDLMLIGTKTGLEQYRYKNGNLTFLSKI